VPTVPCLLTHNLWYLRMSKHSPPEILLLHQAKTFACYAAKALCSFQLYTSASW